MSKYPSDDTFADIKFADTTVRLGLFGEGVFVGIDSDGGDSGTDAHTSAVLPLREARRMRNWLSDAITAWNLRNLADD